MSFRLFERISIILLLLTSMGVIDALTRPSLLPSVISTHVPLKAAIPVTLVYVCGLLIVLMRWRQVLTATRGAYPVVCLAALAPLSILWSHAPLLTARKSVFLLATMFIGIYLGHRFSIEQLARVVAQAMCLMIVAIVVLFFVAPAYVVDYVNFIGALKGLSGAKNTFGGYIAVSVPLLLLIRFRHFRWLRYAFLAMAAAMLVQSRSATALISCGLAILAMPLWRLSALTSSKSRLLVYTVVPPTLLAVVVLMWLNTEAIFQTLGRDATLTGRTRLWSYVVTAILQRPFLGYGFGGFWTGLSADNLNVYIGSGWLPTGSDNAYLDLCLAFGVLGLPILSYVFLYSFRLAHAYVKADSRPIGLWPISFLLYFFLHNICESHLLTPRSLDFLLLTAVITSLARHRLEHKTALRNSFTSLTAVVNAWRRSDLQQERLHAAHRIL